MKSFFYLIFFIFFALSAQAAQTCNPTSIPASTPDSQLTDNGDGTISDTATGLMWKKCLEGLSGNGCETGSADGFNWQQALKRVVVQFSKGISQSPFFLLLIQKYNIISK